MSKVKPVILRDNDTGVEYKLEFNRASVKFAEDHGFVIGDIDKKPMTYVPELLLYSFRMHHKTIQMPYVQHLIDDVWGGIAGIPGELLERLGELYFAPYDAFTDEEKAEKNARVTVEL